MRPNQKKPTEKKAAPKKPSTATTRSTGGPGYQFEDYVSAWLLVKVLVGRPLPGIGTVGDKIKFQVEPVGWRIDDLLVTGNGGAGSAHLAISCKSNHQVTGKGLPADFVIRAWEQWRTTDPITLDKEADTLALVTRGQPNKFPALWSDIVQWCGGGDDAVAVARIRKSASHTTIFDSVRKPEGGQEATDLEAVALIRRLELIPLDFQLEPSKDKEDSIEWCRDLTASGTRPDAEKIWNEIVRLASERRVVGGTITISELWSHLREQFALAVRPDFAKAWQSIRSLSADHLASVGTTLPSGHEVERQTEREAFLHRFRTDSVTLVIGESGAGKSALVKSVLGAEDTNAVWFSPEVASLATSEIDSSRIALSLPLEQILAASPFRTNVLILDSAEKLEALPIARVRALVERLLPQEDSAKAGLWKVVVLTQEEGWLERASSLLGSRSVTPVSVGLLTEAEVATALRSTLNLGWLANDPSSLSALRNLKMLGWAMQAETNAALTSTDLTSPPAMADRIWGHWTQGRLDAQRLLMSLSEREANFERSFPIGKLSSGDATAFDQSAANLPLRTNSRNSLVFEHDLAADWSRFQRLKQDADQHDDWAPLAQNPLWAPALRLLGQFLLREPHGAASAWDAALDSAETRGDKSTTDILLDALCLDPQADQFLGDRADKLLAANGALLERLLQRFLHVATTPRFHAGAFGDDSGVALYLEAGLRNPIISRWPPMARFLHKHIEALARLASPTVSKVCEVWLASTPPRLADGATTPFRREFSEIALAIARTVQVQKGSGILYLRDGWEPIYSAALAGAGDVPEITDWVLEQAHRRKPSKSVSDRIASAKAEKAAAKTKRLQHDPEFAAAEKERAESRRSFPRSIVTSRRLPPWPLGPKDRIDHDFHKAAIVPGALAPFMRADPERAAEALLALMIEGRPEESYSDYSHRDDLGLSHEHSSYPTSFWKSPFFQFLQINPVAALSALSQLVNFATERWASQYLRRGIEVPTLTLLDGEEAWAFTGNGRVFSWAWDEDLGNGQLYCALNALERWLTMEIEVGHNVEQHIDRLLRECRSVAILGVLVNVAKFRPALLEGTLLPLLTAEDLYWLDEGVGRNRQFNMLMWSRAGEVMFNMARDWTFAEYRKQGFQALAVAAIRGSTYVADIVTKAMDTWPEYDSPKDSIESDILRAALSLENYADVAGENGVTQQLEYPAELKARIVAFQNENASRLSNLLLPQHLERALAQGLAATASDAEYLASLLEQPNEGEAGPALLVAIAATLASCAGEWLQDNTEISARVRHILRDAAMGAPSTAEEIRTERIGLDRDDLKFASFGVMNLWIAEGPEWDEPLLRILTSGNRAAVVVAGRLGHQHRAVLGSRWWRLLQLGVFWSGLSMLSHDYGDSEDVDRRWSKWLGTLRSFSLSEEVGPSAVDPMRVWALQRKIERIRWAKQTSNDAFCRPLSDRSPGGLQTDFLDGLFGWLVPDATSERPALEAVMRPILLAFWEYERKWCGEVRNDRDEYHLPYRFGYHVIEALAWVSASDPDDDADLAWQRVLELGSDAHVMLDHFIGAFLLHRGANTILFVRRWQAMIAFAMNVDWSNGRQWFYGQRTLRALFGFGYEVSLKTLPDVASTVLEMKGLYNQWALKYLRRDEENVAAFAHFLASEIGTALRLDGVQWLAAAVRAEGTSFSWDRDGAGSAMVELLDVMLTKHAGDLAKSKDARAGVLAIAADMAAKHVTAALTLQERIKALR